jgi:hypothetical protein
LLLHLQPLSNSHFCFFITAKPLASQLLLHWFKTSFLHSCCVHIQHWISWADCCYQHHGCPAILNSAPFFNMLHSYYAITSMNGECGVIFNGKICFTPKKQFALPWLTNHCHCHCTSSYPLYSIWVTWLLCHLLHITPLQMLPHAPKNKMLTEVADWGTSLVEHASYIAQCTCICLILEWFRPGMVPHVVDYSCSKMKWSVRLKTKTSFTLCVCVVSTWSGHVRYANFIIPIQPSFLYHFSECW